MSFDPDAYLKTLGSMPDQEIDVALAAIALASVNQPGLSLERYVHHLQTLCEEVGTRHMELLDSGADDDVDTQLAALKHIIADKHSYEGDSETYDALENASLIRVIERAKGMPITLSLLYIHAAGAQGWDVAGLDVPAHFLCRLEKDGARVIFDPFACCAKLEAPDLRAIIKAALGRQAELSAEYFEPASNREILIRLQNNIKFRQIEAEDYEGALKTVETMRQVDPDEFRLLLDAGVLYARTKRREAAIDALEEYIKLAPHDRDRHEAAVLLQELKDMGS